MSASSADLDALQRRASSLREAGRVDEAIDAYQRLLSLSPDRPNGWYNLGLLLRRAGRPEAALAAYAESLKRGVGGAEEVHLNRGVIFADDLRRPDLAEAELQRALALQPNYPPAWLNLGNLHEDRGSAEAARTAYARALALDPQSAEALSRLAGLPGADRALVDRLRSAIAAPGRRAGERALLGFALGRLLDAAGEFDDAFAAYAAANTDSRASASPAGPRYDRAAHEAWIESLMRAFPRAPLPLHDDRWNPPIFICGMFRSGSTLVERMLARHPRVTAGGELEVLPSLVARMLSPFPASAVDDARLAAVAAGYASRLGQLFPGADLVTDKRPDNHAYIGLVKAMYPRARFVHTTRDPLDNGLSVYFLHLSHAMPYALDLGDIGHHYRQYRKLTAHWHRCFGDDILDVDYDHLVRDPETELRRVLAFCGLDWHADCLAPQVGGAVRTASVWQVREPVHARSSGRWRHYARHLGPLREALGDLGAVGQTS